MERLVGALGLIPFQPGSGSRILRPVEAALDLNCIDELAEAAQLPSSRLPQMRPDPVDWTMTHTQECSVCAQCLREDLSADLQPYLRVPWRQAWRIFCPVHATRLIACSMHVVRGRWEQPRLIAAIDDLLEHSTMIEKQLEVLHRRDANLRNMTRIIKEMECAIGNAFAGDRQ